MAGTLPAPPRTCPPQKPIHEALLTAAAREWLAEHGKPASGATSDLVPFLSAAERALRAEADL